MCQKIMNTELFFRKQTILQGMGKALPGSKYVTVNMDFKDRENNNENISVSFGTSALPTYPGTKCSAELILAADEKLEMELNKVGFFSDLTSVKNDEEKRHIRKMGIPVLTVEIASLDPLSHSGYIYMMFMVFFFFVDDILDVKIFMDGQQKLNFHKSDLLQFVNDCSDILAGKEYCACAPSSISTEIPEANASIWQLTRLRILLSNVIVLMKEFCPKYVEKDVNKHFISAARNFLLSHVWWIESYPKDDILLESSFTYFRSKRFGADVLSEYLLILKGLIISQNIRDDPVFRRIGEAICKYSFYLNDLLGFSRDCHNNDYDSMIYLSYRNGMDLKSCLNKYTQLLMDEHDEYLILSERFREMYATDESVQSYFNIIDPSLSGQISYYMNVLRYGKQNEK